MIEEDPLQCKQGMVLKMTSEKNCYIVCFREYVESLHQNSTQALLYGKVKMKVTCLFQNWKFSFFREKQCFSVQLWLASTSAWLPQLASGQKLWKFINFMLKINSLQMGSTVQLKWTPNSLMDAGNNSLSTGPRKLSPGNGISWQQAISINMATILYIHCHQVSTNGWLHFIFNLHSPL